MMAGVNNAKDYYTLMGFGHQDPETGAPVITKTILQGGIVSVYYLGTLVGALAGGKFSDMYGRIKSIALGAAWAILGASLQCSAQNHNWMICARLINGIGTGKLHVYLPASHVD
jgi:MFS family permease